MLKIEVDEELLEMLLALYMDYYYDCFQNNEKPIKFGKYVMDYLNRRRQLTDLKNIDEDRLN